MIGVAEQSNNAEESLREFGFLLEALEDATDVEHLWLFGLRAFVVEVDCFFDEIRSLLCDLAQSAHLARDETRHES